MKLLLASCWFAEFIWSQGLISTVQLYIQVLYKNEIVVSVVDLLNSIRPKDWFQPCNYYIYMYQITECSVLKSDPPIHPSRKETQQTNHYLWAYNTFAQVHYLYFSIILRASSTGSSDGSPIASSNLEPEASFGFIARKPRYMRPIIACKTHHLAVSSTIKTEPQKTGM